MTRSSHIQIQTDVIRVLQGKLGGCTVNSQDVILNHTTYYLNPDAHIFNKTTSFQSNNLYSWQEIGRLSIRLTPGCVLADARPKSACIFKNTNMIEVRTYTAWLPFTQFQNSFTTGTAGDQKSKSAYCKTMIAPLWQRPTEASLCCQICHKIGSTGLCQMVVDKVSKEMFHLLRRERVPRV